MKILRPLTILVLCVSVTFVASCTRERDPKIKWSQPETFFIVDRSEHVGGGMTLEFHFLIDAPADKVYAALVDVENYDGFVPRVQHTKLVSSTENTKTIEIAQTVIGQQTRATVRWDIDPARKAVTFETLRSDGSYTDGSYRVFSNREGTRCYVISKFKVKQRGLAEVMPIGMLAASVRASVGEAARAFKKRALEKHRGRRS